MFAGLALARAVLGDRRVSELSTIERCAAYVAARGAIAAIDRAAATWPPHLAVSTRRLAIDGVLALVEGLGHPHGTPARRRCLRAGLVHALDVSAGLDIVRAMGVDASDGGLDRALAASGRTIALLSLFLHANSHRVADDD